MPVPSQKVKSSKSTFARIAQVVRRIPRGRVMTYGDVAAAAGMPGAARTVGYAMHTLGPSVPWQRVMGRRNARSAHITIREASARERQRSLLEREGVRFTATGSVDLARYGHKPSGVGARRSAGSAVKSRTASARK